MPRTSIFKERFVRCQRRAHNLQFGAGSKLAEMRSDFNNYSWPARDEELKDETGRRFRRFPQISSLEHNLRPSAPSAANRMLTNGKTDYEWRVLELMG